MKREFKDLIRFEQYECLNSEIKGGYDKAHAVKCVNGTFVGTEEHGVVSWLGIPYAKPPVGGRRFKAPEYVDASERVFEAKYYGKGAFGSLGYPDCIQKLMSEDCLYLNIWLNADDKSVKKPVMVWIHGGAYVVGSGSQASYSGANLVQAHSDIIMVTINYRLNMYGFMDFSSVPGGEDFKTAPCNGLLDQAMALRWVHENIAAFGGDPDNVTIFGQSAGGGSVSILPVMKEANRYFQKVIAQSGSATLAFPVDWALLEYTGCKTMDEIMALSEEELQKAYLEAVGQFTSCPYYGTEVLPEAPIELYRKGYAKHISIMAGSTADEARLFMGEGPELSLKEQKLFATRAVGDAAQCLKEEDKKYYEEFKRVCRFQEPGLIETEFINELMFRVPMLQQLNVQSMSSCSGFPCSCSSTCRARSTRRSPTTGPIQAAMRTWEPPIPWSSCSCSTCAASGQAAPSTAPTTRMRYSRPLCRCGPISPAAATLPLTRWSGRRIRPTTRTSLTSPDRVTCVSRRAFWPSSTRPCSPCWATTSSSTSTLPLTTF